MNKEFTLRINNVRFPKMKFDELGNYLMANLYEADKKDLIDITATFYTITVELI